MNMNNVPVTASTISAGYLGQFLREKYGFDPTTTCKLFRTGINHLYVVTTAKGRFVFRVYTLNWRTRFEISEEIRLLNHLKENNVPVAYPIADKNNNFIQLLNAPEGERFGVLFSFAPGAKMSAFSQQASFHIGVAMARMHRLTENFQLQRVTYSPQTLLVDSLAISKSFFLNTSDDMIFVDRTTKYLIQEYNAVKTSEVRHGVIHFDIWFDNLHFNGGDEITIFDFDFCGNGWLCYDIAYFMLQLYNTQKSEIQYEEKLKSFLEGYESVVAISKEEKRIIPFLSISIWFFYLGTQCDRFDNWSNVFLSEEYLKRFIGMIKKWMAYNRIEIEN